MTAKQNLDAIVKTCDSDTKTETPYSTEEIGPSLNSLNSVGSAEDGFVSNIYSEGYGGSDLDLGDHTQGNRSPARKRFLITQTKQGSAHRRPSAHITLRQARNLMEGLAYARTIGVPLNAHLTVHWAGTSAGDDPKGLLFAKFRNLLSKRLKRRGVEYGLLAIWVLERQNDRHSDGLGDTVHAHMLFHLPSKYERAPWRSQISLMIEELVELVANGVIRDRTTHLNFPGNPDALYLLKGGSLSVRQVYTVPASFCKTGGEGIINAKRCGTTQNIGPAARTAANVSRPECPR